MGRYTDASKDLVKERSAIADIAGDATALRRSGPDELTGLCPFHEERTPSFKVTPSKGLFRCWGCDAKGDVFTFVMAHRGVDFVGAVEHLADRAGVQLKRDEETPAQRAARERTKRLLAVMDRAAGFYARHLHAPAGARALSYLQYRGLMTPVLDAFAIGFAPASRTALLSAATQSGTTVQDLVATGLATAARDGKPAADRFHDRIVFPICDWSGRVVGFGARRLADSGAKYVNTPRSALFAKGSLLYGASHARHTAARTGTVVVVEGYTDVLAFHEAGMTNTVAAMGTAVTEQQIGLLKRLAPIVVFVMDGDTSGQDAAARAGALAQSAGLDVRIALLPSGSDPADVAVADDGATRVAELITAAVSFPRFQLATHINRSELCTAESKDALLHAARPIVAGVRPGPLREAVVEQLAAALQFPAATVATWLETSSEPARTGAESLRSQRALLQTAIGDEKTVARLDPATFADPVCRRAAELLAGHPADLVAAIPAEDTDLARLITLLLTT